LADNVGICVCWLHHPNDRHFSLSPTCRKCQPDTSATFCYISHFFGCRCCVGELYPRHTFLCVGRKWYYTFLGMCHVSHACKKQVFVAKNILQGAQNDFLFQRTFCEEHTTYKMFSGLVVFHSFARSTHHKQLLSCLVVFHALAVYHSKGDDWVHCLRTFIKRTTLTPFQSRSVSGYIYLCLLGGKTLKFSTSRPGIRTLARHLRSLGLLVNFYPFPTNTLESIHPNIWRYIVLIADTLIISIPHAAVAREYESIWYANSFSSSNSSSNNSHANPMS
jgi:hypothetical protein